MTAFQRKQGISEDAVTSITLSGGEIVFVSQDDWLWAVGYTWSLNKRGYAHGWVDGRNRLLHECIASRMGITGESDHKDQNKLNCQRFNLRPATRTQNLGNIKKYRHNTSGYKGVSWDNRRQKYEAYISVANHKKHLGRFDTAEEAAQAYNDAAIKHFGEFACLNKVLV